MTDVLLFQIDDGGNIEFDENGNPILSDDGLETAAYLSLFGGNLHDSGVEADDPAQWWGNFGEVETSRRYRSETQNLIQGLPSIPANLIRIEDAAGRDLKWFVDTGIADSVEVNASVPNHNRLDLQVEIRIDGETFTFTFITVTE